MVKHLNTTSAQKTVKIGDTMHLYHRQLAEILTSRTKHEQQLKNITIPLGRKNKMKYFDITCPSLYIIAGIDRADNFVDNMLSELESTKTLQEV